LTVNQRNRSKMRENMMNGTAKMLEASRIRNVKTYDNDYYPNGYTRNGYRENGVSKDSLLNKWNQMHEVLMFCCDGSCMPSIAWSKSIINIYGFNGSSCGLCSKKLKRKYLGSSYERKLRMGMVGGVKMPL
jgi:hypothetical protein